MSNNNTANKDHDNEDHKSKEHDSNGDNIDEPDGKELPWWAWVLIVVVSIVGGSVLIGSIINFLSSLSSR